MPRNITVTFDDGSTHVYQNAPDNVTPDQVSARAQTDFGKKVTSLDGGRGGVPPAIPKVAAPAPKMTAAAAQTGLDRGSAILEEKIKGLPEADKQRARDIYFQRTQGLRLASARPARSIPTARFPQEQVQASAQQRADNTASNVGNFLTALRAGITRGAFGIPERLAAAGEAYLPSSITGNTSNASYDEILNQIRANTDAEMNKGLAGNILGQLLSGGGIAGRVAKTVGAGIAAAPRLAQAAEAVSAAAPRLSKVATAAIGGAAGGGAQAVGEGSDVGHGAAMGAVMAPLGMGAVKAIKFVSRPIGDLLGLPQAATILKRFTTATKEQLQAAADEFRQRTGAEPTLYELMPLADRNAVTKQVFGSSPAVSENVVRRVRARIGNMGPEMQNSVHAATGDQRIRILGQMADDMHAAQGGAPDAAPLPGMEAAARSPLDLKNFQGAEANAHMAPVRDTQVADRVQSMFPTAMQRNPDTGEIEEVFSDPEVNAAITNAASTLRLRMDGDASAVGGITADEISRIFRQLSKVPPGTPQKGAAMRAEQTIMDYMAQNHPEAAGTIENMRNAYAARARMIEGMAEGGRTRTRESIPVETSAQARVVNNAFGTPEGAAGRQLGQTNALNRELGGTTNDVGATLENITGSGETQRALSQNLGPQAAGEIGAAAEAQATSARRLATIQRESGQEADTLNLKDLGHMILGLSPHAMPTTKLWSIARLTQLARMPERKAQQITDLLLSQDPAVTNKAIAMLRSAGEPGRQFLKEFRNGIVTGQITGEMANAGGNNDAGPSPVIPQANAADIGIPMTGPDGMQEGNPADLPQLDAETSAESSAGSEEPDSSKPYGHQVVAALFPEAHITSDVRSPDDPLSKANPNSKHVTTDEAVDVRPIPGMTFEEFIRTIEDAGYTVIEKRDEVKNPVGYATGPHWHVVIG